MFKRVLVALTFASALGVAGLGMSSKVEAYGRGHRSYGYGGYAVSSYPAFAAFGYGPGVYGYGPGVSWSNSYGARASYYRGFGYGGYYMGRGRGHGRGHHGAY